MKTYTDEQLKEIRYKTIQFHQETLNNENSISVYTDYHGAMIEYASLISSDKDRRIKELEERLKVFEDKLKEDMSYHYNPPVSSLSGKENNNE